MFNEAHPDSAASTVHLPAVALLFSYLLRFFHVTSTMIVKMRDTELKNLKTNLTTKGSRQKRMKYQVL
jgi:hypothetical protein